MNEKAAEMKRTLEQRVKGIWNSLPHCSGYPTCDGDLIGEPHEMACPLHGQLELTALEFATFLARELLEEAAKIAESTHVLHGDHYASYDAPSSDGKAIAARIRQMKEGW